MVARSRFFVASLWAALPPTALLLIAAVTLVFFPEVHRLGRLVARAGALALLLVPCAYTAGVVCSYGMGRILYELRWLSRRSFIATYCIAAVLVAALLTKLLAAGNILDITRSFALFLTLSLIAAGSAAFVWWRAASLGAPATGGAIEDELAEMRSRPRRRMRRGSRRQLASRR